MLGLILLFFLAKGFYQLAEKHGRNKWLFGILAIVVYYGSVISLGFLLGVLIVAFEWEAMLEMNEFVLSLILMAIGFVVTWLVREMLRKNWENNPKDQNPELLDGTDL